MGTTLITGATGFIGHHLARKLCREGCAVRALVRPNSPQGALAGLALETVCGDLTDLASLQRAVAGCSTVFHVAADYRLWAKYPQELYRSNVQGTEDLLEAAMQAGVERFVYTSTVGTLKFSREGTPVNEQSSGQLEGMSGHYKRSKFLAEQAVLRRVREGFPAVIVNPSAPVGDGDRKPTETGKIILDFLNRKMPAYLETGLNLVDVADIAEGHWLAFKHGRIGERYILGGRNMSLQQMLQTLAQITGLRAPSIKMPYSVALFAGTVDSWIAGILNRPPRVPVEGVRMARYKMYVSSAKAEQELGYQPGPIEPALERAVRWFQENGYVREWEARTATSRA